MVLTRPSRPQSFLWLLCYYFRLQLRRYWLGSKLLHPFLQLQYVNLIRTLIRGFAERATARRLAPSVWEFNARGRGTCSWSTLRPWLGSGIWPWSSRLPCCPLTCLASWATFEEIRWLSSSCLNFHQKSFHKHSFDSHRSLTLNLDFILMTGLWTALSPLSPCWS